MPLAVCLLAIMSFFLSSLEAVLVGNAKICAVHQVRWLKPTVGLFIAAKLFAMALRTGKN